MRTTKAELAKDMESFVFQMEYYRPGEDCAPVCPLCNNSETDYRALTDAEVKDAWAQAEVELECLRYLPSGDDGWKGMGCHPDWRDRWKHNHERFITVLGL